MGKKPWINYTKLCEPPFRRRSLPYDQTNSSCGVVASSLCRLNNGLGCTCGKWNTSKQLTEDDFEAARNFDVKKALEQAILERKSAKLPI